MGGQRTVAERDQLQQQAYDLSVRQLSLRDIGATMGLDKDTVGRYVAAEKKRRREAMSREERDMQVERSVATRRAVQRAAWREYARPNDSNKSGYLNTVLKAEKEIDSVLGLVVEKHDVTSGGKSLDEALSCILDRVVTFVVPDDDNPFDGG